MQMLKIPQKNTTLVCMQSFSMVAKNQGNQNTQVEQRKSSQEAMRIQGRFKRAEAQRNASEQVVIDCIS